MSDIFKAMWDDQTVFMRMLEDLRLFPNFPVDIASKTGQQDIVNVFHHCNDELYEAKSELKNAKRHRVTEINEFDRDHYIEELVDTQKLLLELLIMSGVSIDEFVEAFWSKSKTNVKRIQEKY